MIPEAKGLEKVGGIGADRKVSFGPHVHRAVVKRNGTQLPANTVVGFKHVDLMVAEFVSGRKPGKARTNDRDLHGLVLLVDNRHGLGDNTRVCGGQHAMP